MYSYYRTCCPKEVRNGVLFLLRNIIVVRIFIAWSGLLSLCDTCDVQVNKYSSYFDINESHLLEFNLYGDSRLYTSSYILHYLPSFVILRVDVLKS